MNRTSKSFFTAITLLIASAPASTARAEAWSSKGTIRSAAQSHGTLDFAVAAEAEKRNPRTPEHQYVHPPMTNPLRISREALRRGSGRGSGGVVPPPLFLGLPSPPTSVSFQASFDTGWIPPDTHGAVGPNHLVVVHNGLVRVMSRTGTILSSVALNTFWAPVEPNPFVFDPKVLYEPFDDRWITTALGAADSPDSSVLVGVSQTGNPLGMWNLYRIDADPNDTYWADYPSIGFNRDWIAVQENMFTVGAIGLDVPSPRIYLFTKADLYSGGPGAHREFSIPFGWITPHPAVTYDEELQSLYFLQTLQNDDGNGHGTLKMLTIDGPVGDEVLTERGLITTPFAWFISFYIDNFLPQLGTSLKIESFDDRMRSVIYRNGSLWAAHTIKLPRTNPPERSAVQWFEIRPDRTILQHGLIDSPSGGQFFEQPSLAVNRNNDVLIGYSRFSATQYASANYSFRRAGDPAGSMRDDTVLKAGETPYFKDFGSGRNRWGDYSATLVDPLNDREMWTIQEYAASPGSTWGTWWGKIPVECGNGILDLGEQCDDGNDVASDGCTNNCTVCGNGTITAPEQCDDNNLADDDGCDANCLPTACGNGILTSGEVCDDGNLTNNDGCDANCTLTACGNHAVGGLETCDDGNLIDGDGCDSNCKITGCGSGIVTSGEACDDGNLISGDGCDANCTLTACGNGIRTAGESCDDGNLVNGDGCQADCTVTPHHDNVVVPLKPLNITIPSGVASVSKTIQLKVVNADVLPSAEQPGHLIELTANLGDCPLGTVTSGPQFASGGNTILLHGGKSAAAKLTLHFAAASFTSFNRLAPTRCVLSFAANTLPLGESIDPTAANSSATLDISVLDLNDTESNTPHESLIRAIPPTRLSIGKGKVFKSKSIAVEVRNADYQPGEIPGDTLTVSASDGTCPPGTVSGVDMSSQPGAQSSVVVAGGATAKGKVSIFTLSSTSTSPNKKSPARCSITIQVSGPGGDTDATNSTTSLTISVTDKNDF